MSDTELTGFCGWCQQPMTHRCRDGFCTHDPNTEPASYEKFLRAPIKVGEES